MTWSIPEIDSNQEWPTVNEAIAPKWFDFTTVGCENELVSTFGKTKGQLLLKTWRIKTNCPTLETVVASICSHE